MLVLVIWFAPFPLKDSGRCVPTYPLLAVLCCIRYDSLVTEEVPEEAGREWQWRLKSRQTRGGFETEVHDTNDMSIDLYLYAA